MKLVDVAIFTFPNDASILESILSSEGIEYYINNQDGAIIVPGSGVILSVLDKDYDRVVHLVKEAGFEHNLLTA